MGPFASVSVCVIEGYVKLILPTAQSPESIMMFKLIVLHTSQRLSTVTLLHPDPANSPTDSLFGPTPVA